MSINTIMLKLSEPVEKWHHLLMKKGLSADFILLPNRNNIDDFIWFISNYTQFLSREGRNEVAVLHGEAIKSIESFIRQINLILPVGYQLSIRPQIRLHALYDLLLNFETEPTRRFLIWNDANILFNINRIDFDDIFDLMVSSAYCNRNAISSIKEDGTRYKVDQRNIFIFHESNFDDIKYLIEKEQSISSIDMSEDRCMKVDFNVVELID